MAVLITVGLISISGLRAIITSVADAVTIGVLLGRIEREWAVVTTKGNAVSVCIRIELGLGRNVERCHEQSEEPGQPEATCGKPALNRQGGDPARTSLVGSPAVARRREIVAIEELYGPPLFGQAEKVEA
jgi:hypothetical protein